MIRAALVLLCLSCAAAGAQEDARGGDAAPDLGAALAAAAEGLARADTALAAANGDGGAEDRIAALSLAVQAYEEARESLRTAEAATAAEERRMAREVKGQDATLRRLLAGLERLSARSEPLFALGVGDPAEVVQAALLLDRVSDGAAARVAELRGSLGALRDLRARQQLLQAQTRTAIGALRSAREALIALSDATPPAMPDFGQDAANLTALAIALAGLPDASATTDAPPEPLASPVAAWIVQGFNEEGLDGGRRPGILLAGPAGRLVISPVAATVRYAGELDSYGTVVIVEPSPGVLFVFAGLTGVLVKPGAQIDAGTGLGFLPGLHEEVSDTTLQAGGQDQAQTLYMEVRVNGTPVDPGLWFEFET